MTPRRRLPGLPLRARLTTTFAVVTLLATILVSATTFLLARQYLLDQRERSALRQTFLNARLVRDLVQAGDQEPQAILDSTVAEVGTLALLRVGDQWYASGVAADPKALPASLLAALDDNAVAHQRVTRNGGTRLLIGIPLRAVDAQYVEVVPLDNLERTLRTLLLSLVIGSAGTTIVGALVGFSISRRVLRPVQRMSAVASGIAAGGLDQRLTGGDRDLDSLVLSFNTMVDSLQERIEREQRFSAAVSHELRTPLTVMKASIGIVEQRAADLPPRSRDAIGMLAKQVDYFEQLVLDLLQISRFDAGIEEPNLEETDIVEYVESLMRQLDGPPVEVSGPGSSRLGVDRRRVERIIGNLVENAQRYAGGAVAITIDLGTDQVAIGVCDAGPGVSVDERDQIFERFRRGRGARHQSSRGSGLGLALVAEHARVLGGHVCVTDRSGGGACFTLTLPREAGW